MLGVQELLKIYNRVSKSVKAVQTYLIIHNIAYKFIAAKGANLQTQSYSLKHVCDNPMEMQIVGCFSYYKSHFFTKNL
jgi:hypothetical protein